MHITHAQISAEFTWIIVGGLIRLSWLDSGTVIVSSAVLRRPARSLDRLTNANLLYISWLLLTEDYHGNCPLSTNTFYLQSPCLQMNMMLMRQGCIRPWTPVKRSFLQAARNWDTNLLHNQLFQGGKSSRAQTAQRLLGGKAEPPLTFH